MKTRRRKVIVRTSRLGRGVFALTTLEPESIIGTVRGYTTRNYHEEPDYSIEVDNELVLIPKPPFRYLNHSCSPNCELLQIDGDEEDARLGSRPIYVRAQTAIHPGEELSIDYGWPQEYTIPCLCGSPNCCGWISGA